ncbi:MAG: PLP-dependent aminotransferase family protein, partial [Hydromonas sp.]|nr:PLP-dependent aminotransferase family protein [Hydromonas sp.]
TQYMPKSVTWNQPAGGMFLWLQLPAGVDSEEILEKALARNVAYVPGVPFYANEPARNTMRLAFVTVPEDKIREGVKVLGEVFGG